MGGASLVVVEVKGDGDAAHGMQLQQVPHAARQEGAGAGYFSKEGARAGSVTRGLCGELLTGVWTISEKCEL